MVSAWQMYVEIISTLAIRPRQVVSRFLVTARTKSVKSEVWPLFVLRMRSQFLRPFSRIINENLRIMHLFLRLQPWILDFAKILQTRATSGSAGTWFSHLCICDVQ